MEWAAVLGHQVNLSLSLCCENVLIEKDSGICLFLSVCINVFFLTIMYLCFTVLDRRAHTQHF